MASRGLRETLRAGATVAVGLLTAWLAVLPSEAATSSVWQRTPESAVRLISAVEGAGALESLPLGLEFDLAPGWKTYWRSPGDGGFAPRLDWTGSENVASAHVAWPAPKRFSILGIDSVGYSDGVVLPIELSVAEPGEVTRLRLALEYLTCDEICIPQRAEVALDIPAGASEPSTFAHLIDRFRGRVPGPPGPMLSIDSAEWAGPEGQPRLEVVATGETAFRQPDLFIEGAPSARWGTPSYVLASDGSRATITVPRLDRAAAEETGAPLTLTLVDGERAVEQRLTVGSARPPMATPPTGGEAGLFAALAVALLGGLILNLMPCVLPVLSIKVLGLLKHGGADVSAVRRSFVATSAGIVASFLALAAGAAGVRATGVAVGWGIQFQQPAFLVAMTLVLVLFACNLWGFYEISMPRWLGERVARPVGGSELRGGGLTGPFLTGMLATLLATPCSAPFVGTAVAFALSRGVTEIFLIFAALGVGLALPYLAIAAYPRAATALPRPGRWMVWLRRALGFALLGTAAWLLFVLLAQTGPVTTAVVLGIAVGLIVVLSLRSRAPPAFRATAAGLMVVAAMAAPFAIRFDPPAGEAVADARWTAFDRGAIERLVGEGRVVFVDVTADWCITCQVNKAVVLERSPVAQRLFGGGPVTPMQADWTRPSDSIATYLASFGRYGIPFNAVYGPGAPEGIPLPELLTPEVVLNAMDEASERRPRAVSAR